MTCHAAACRQTLLRPCFKSHRFKPKDAKMAAPNLELARVVYRSIRDCWVARGSALEAHERLSVITVAAGLRAFAFLTHIDTDDQSTAAQLFRTAGLSAHLCSFPF